MQPPHELCFASHLLFASCTCFRQSGISWKTAGEQSDNCQRIWDSSTPFWVDLTLHHGLQFFSANILKQSLKKSWMTVQLLQSFPSHYPNPKKTWNSVQPRDFSLVLGLLGSRHMCATKAPCATSMRPPHSQLRSDWSIFSPPQAIMWSSYPPVSWRCQRRSCC